MKSTKIKNKNTVSNGSCFYWVEQVEEIERMQSPEFTEENEMSKISRKSLFYSMSLKKNSLIKKNILIALRPGYGVSPMNIPKILGKRIKCDVKINEPFNFKHITK